VIKKKLFLWEKGKKEEKNRKKKKKKGVFFYYYKMAWVLFFLEDQRLCTY